MCGFTGYFLKNSIELDSTPILEMLKLQKHRGPDDSGILGINTHSGSVESLPLEQSRKFLLEPNLVFGFNRLSILDLSPAGHQPMVNSDSTVALMMNGEVYNAFDFKEELELKGFTFKGHSDTEVVLNLYLAYGIDGLLSRLNGMIALAIYDVKESALFLVRDRLGIKPLYVLTENNRIAFSSEMKSFKALPDFKFQLDESKLSEFLLFRNVVNATLFQNIKNLEPGTYWKVNQVGDVSIHTYYDLRLEGTKRKNTTKQDLSTTLKNSVKRQMISDVNLGCQLSGGVDSSLITAFATEHQRVGDLETFSIVFDQKNYSEKTYIDGVVAKFGLKSHQFALNATSYLNLIDEAVWHFEMPLNHPNTIGIKLLSKEAKKRVSVLLSGEGADEIFAGYSRFLPDNHSLFSIGTLKKIFKNRMHISDFAKAYGIERDRYIMQTAFGNLSTVNAMYRDFSLVDSLENRRNVWNSLKDEAPKRKRKYELLTYLPDLLMRQDKMSMAHSIENRVPFLDNELVELALETNDAAYIQKRNGKWEGKSILKEISSEIFGKKFSYRNKMGFAIPLKDFFSSKSFQKRWQDEILPGIENRKIFHTQPISNWMKTPQKLNPEELDAIWLMLVFEIWAKQYLD